MYIGYYINCFHLADVLQHKSSPCEALENAMTVLQIMHFISEYYFSSLALFDEDVDDSKLTLLKFFV